MSSFYGFLVIGLCGLAAMSAEALPKLECENAKYDFGTQIAGEAITNQFVLRNHGDDPIEILEIKDCCGVTSTMTPMLLAPGTNAVCTSVFDTRNREGEQEKQILLVTNDKRKPYFDLRMVGTLNKAIEFSPRYVRLQDVLPDSGFSETITATNLLPEAVVLKSVEVTIDGLSAEIVDAVESEPRTEAPRSWTIQLKSNAPLAVGQINGTLKLNFSTGTVDIPVVGDVAPIVQSTPEQIQFSSTSTGLVKRMAMLRSGDGRAFDLLSAELKDAEGTVSFKKLSAGKWQLSLSVQSKSVAPGAAVEVKTSLESQPLIRIPLVK